MKKLSICIPTFNRSEFIVQLLTNIAVEVRNADLRDIVEIVVSDNASSDNTEKAVNEFMQNNKSLDILYSKNDHNIANLNFLKVVEIAHGEYCWIIGDDDLIIEGGLKRILKEINNADIVLTGYDLYDKDMKACKGKLNISKSLTERTIYNFYDKNEIIRYLDSIDWTVGLFLFLSNVVFKRDRWMNEETFKIARTLNNTQAVHVYMHLRTINEGCLFEFLPESIVKFRSGNYVEDYADGRYYCRYYTIVKGLSTVYTEAISDREVRESAFEMLRREYVVFKFCGKKLKKEESELIDSFYGSDDLEIFKQVNTSYDEMATVHAASEIVLFGASFHGEYTKNKLDQAHIPVSCFCDNAKEKWGTTFLGCRVISPEELARMDNAVVLITSMYVREIFKQLSALGIKNIKHIAK